MIQAYTGLPGTGKTFAMVYDAIPLIRSGAKVISNFPVKWMEGKKEYKTLFLNPVDFLTAIEYENNATFLVDECNVIFSSYDDAKKIDRGLLNKFAQGRKLNLDFYYTSQRFNHSLKRLRDLTNIVIQARKRVFFTFTFFQNTYYNPIVFDRQNVLDTPLEEKYIIKRRLILPFQVSGVYKKYDTNFIVRSKSEWITRNDKPIDHTPIEI